MTIVADVFCASVAVTVLMAWYCPFYDRFAFGGNMPSFAKRQSDHGAASDTSPERIPKVTFTTPSSKQALAFGGTVLSF